MQELLRSGDAHGAASGLSQAFITAKPELISLLPEYADHFDTGTPEIDKYRLYQAVADFCGHLASHQPLLLLVEDLHWSDEASLDMLLNLARKIVRAPILLAGTYRSNEVDADLRHFLAQLDRERLTSEINIDPLSRQQSDQMIQAIFEQKQSFHSEFLDSIYGMTEGNPFFLEETLNSLILSGDLSMDGWWSGVSLTEQHVPRSIQDSVYQRSRRLSPEAYNVLNLAAVAGRRFEFNLLQSLTQTTEVDLLHWLKELIAAQLLVEESADHFAFRHALTREAVYNSLMVRERRSLHQIIAETTIANVGMNTEPQLAILAYHTFRGELWDKALIYAEQAGIRAMALYAPHAAVDLFGKALQATTHIFAAPVARLHLHRGQALARWMTLRRHYGNMRPPCKPLNLKRTEQLSGTYCWHWATYGQREIVPKPASTMKRRRTSHAQWLTRSWSPGP